MNTIQILEGGKLSPSYDNVIDFKDIKAQNKYWEGQKLYSRDVKTPIAFFEEYPSPLVLPYSMKEAKNFNYLRINVQVGEDPEFGTPVMKWYYYFILNVKYVTPETCSFTLQLDVWQTYMFDYEFYESFIEREHQDRYDKNGNPIFNRMPEDLDLGEKGVVSTPKIIGDSISWFHIVTKVAIGIKSNFIVDGTNFCDDYRAVSAGLPQGFFHYLLPFDKSNPTKTWRVNYRGKTYTLEDSRALISSLATSEQTVVIRLLPSAPVNYSIGEDGSLIFDESIIIQQPNNQNFIIADDSGAVPTPTKRVNVAFADTVNGTITGDSYGVPNELYTVKVEPNEKYKLTKLYYNIEGGATGNEISLNTKSFIMPGVSAITIYAEFNQQFVAHVIKYSPETPDPKMFSRNAPSSAIYDNDVLVSIFPKKGYKVTTSANTTYQEDGNNIRFKMPDRDVLVTSRVSEQFIYTLNYVVRPQEVTFVTKPTEYDIRNDIVVKVKANKGYQLLGCTWKTSGGTIVPGGTQSNEQYSGDNLVAATFTLPADKTVERNMYAYILSGVADEPRPEKPTEYTFSPVIDGRNPGSVPYNPETMGWIKINNTKYSPGDTISYIAGDTLEIEAYSFYQIDEYTGQGGYVLGLLKLKNALGVEIKQYQLDIYEPVPGTTTQQGKIYHYKASYKTQIKDSTGHTEKELNPVSFSLSFFKEY